MSDQGLPTNNNNNDNNNNNPSLPAMAAARAAAAQQLARGGGVVVVGQPDGSGGTSPTRGRSPLTTTAATDATLRPANSNIMANRSSSPTAAFSNAEQQLLMAQQKKKSAPISIRGQFGGNLFNFAGMYPLPITTNFVPGGVQYEPKELVTSKNCTPEHLGENNMIYLSNYCSTYVEIGKTTFKNEWDPPPPSSQKSPKLGPLRSGSGRGRSRSRGLSIDTGDTTNDKGKGEKKKRGPEDIIYKALVADATLREYSLHFAATGQGKDDSATTTPVVGQRLPSLSQLSNSVLVNPLTAVPSTSAVEWAEKMIMEYIDGRFESKLLHTNNNSSSEEGGNDYDTLRELSVEFNTVLEKELGTTLQNSNEALHKNKKLLLQHAILSAWSDEETATGRTPTNSDGMGMKVSDTPLEDALMMELPTLKGLLKAIWRVQRGVDTFTNNKLEGPGSDGSGANKNEGLGSSTTRDGDVQCKPVYDGGPCGYVFRRGDIAWNCRTCQTDATCVQCDACFRESDHEGHDVFFHRTNPGGCCDCGDLEAWHVKGMCPRHCPPDALAGQQKSEDNDGEEEDTIGVVGGGDDDFEAVRAAQRTRLDHVRHVNGTPSSSSTSSPNVFEPLPLPPRFVAALATIIGSTIQSILVAAEGSAIGADVTQWRLKWSDEICKIWNGVSDDEEYYRRGAVLLGRMMDEKSARGLKKSEGGDEEKAEEEEEELWAHPRHLLDSNNEHYLSQLPVNESLYLRLHNDDVHTFEEVIKALRDKSEEPIAVPVGGRGSVGEIGGAGVRGDKIKTLCENAAGVGNDDAMAIMAEELSNSVTRSLRNRPFVEDSETSQQQRRAFSSSDASGVESPTWNRSPTHTDAATLPSAAGGGDARPPLINAVQSEVDPSSPLVPREEAAQNLTRKVDADGQVLVHPYNSINSAGIGFSRLRESAGLHCGVMTAARLESEERAKVLLEWLGSLIGAHPAVASLVVQGLVDVTDGEDVLCHEDTNNDSVSANIPGMSKGVAVWTTPRMMPCWSGTSESWWQEEGGSSNSSVPAWRKRLDAFPPHLESSYLTREEGRELFRQGMMLDDSASFVAKTGEILSCSFSYL